MHNISREPLLEDTHIKTYPKDTSMMARIYNSLPNVVKQNLFFFIVGIILVLVALSFHRKEILDDSNFLNNINKIQDEGNSEKFRHYIVYNYQKFVVEPNTERSGFVVIYYDPTTNTVGDQAKESETKKSIMLFFREKTPENLNSKSNDMLMLHGAAFTSLTWEKIDTLSHVRDNGYRVVAVDLPGYGESPAANILPLDMPLFMRAVFTSFNLKKAVLVSPSMSGKYAIPYIFSDERTNFPYHMGAWIPVAPVGIRDHSEDQYQTLKFKTWIVYGDKDASGRAQSLQFLAKIPDNEIFGMIGGEHPCYMTNPDMWNEKLIKFLALL